MKLKLAVLRAIHLFVFVAITSGQSVAYLTSSFTPCSNNANQGQSASRRDGYRLIEAARGITKDGRQASFATYESSDSIMIFTRTEFFRSAAAMKTQIETETKRFSEIIERGDVKDSQGNIKGERIVGKYSADKPEIIQYAIVWSHKLKISYIESISLDNILDFEKKFYKSQK